MNIIGTIVVGLGVSLSANIWLIVLGGLLVLAGNTLPLLYTKGGFDLFYFESACLRHAERHLPDSPPHKMELLPFGRDPIFCGVIESLPL